MVRPLSSSPSPTTPLTSTKASTAAGVAPGARAPGGTSAEKPDSFELARPAAGLLAHLSPAGPDTPAAAGGGDPGDPQPSPTEERRAGTLILTETFPKPTPGGRETTLGGKIEPIATRREGQPQATDGLRDRSTVAGLLEPVIHR